MPSNTYGITLQTLRERSGMEIRDKGTLPNEATALQILEEAAAEVSRQAIAMGIPTEDLTASDETYPLFRSAVLYRSLQMLILSANRGGNEGANNYQQLYSSSISQLRNFTTIYQKDNITRTVPSRQEIQEEFQRAEIRKPIQNTSAWKIANRRT